MNKNAIIRTPDFTQTQNRNRCLWFYRQPPVRHQCLYPIRPLFRRDPTDPATDPFRPDPRRISGIMRRISFLRRQRYYTSSFRTRTQKWKWENQHHSGSFSDPPYETAPPDRKTVSLHLPGHAGIQCRLRRKHLSGSFPPSGRTSGSYAAILFPGRDQS